MRIKIKKRSLITALKVVKAIAKRCDRLPILENMRLSIIDNELILKATDLKTTITYTLASNELEIIEPGELLLPAIKLYNLVKETPDEEVIIEKENFNGILISKDGKCCIRGEDPQKFPDIPQFEAEYSFELLGEDFKKLIKKTVFVTTKQLTRYDLDHVLVDILEDKLRFVATDGKRLAIFDRPYKAIGEVINKQLTVPAQGLQQIDRVLSATTPETVMLSFLDSQLLFRTREVILSIKLSDAKFPPYQKVMPSVLPFKATLTLKDFSSALKRVCLMADDKNKIVTISFNSTVMNFFAHGEGSREAKVNVPCLYNGEPFDIKFNPNLLLEVLKVLDSEKLNFLVKDGQSAILIKEGEDFSYIVLPIKKEKIQLKVV